MTTSPQLILRPKKRMRANMGQIWEGACEGCGFKQSVVIGGGRETFHKHSVWPVHCRECDDLEATNTCVSPLRCLKCGSDSVTKYGDPSISESGPEVVKWGDDRLSSGEHYCPRCQQMKLKFGSNGPRLFFS